jgi:H+/Cl- antiporter ClcA
MEMTNSTELVLPLMATAFIVHISSHVICPHTVYRVLAESFRPGSGGISQAAKAAS